MDEIKQSEPVKSSQNLTVSSQSDLKREVAILAERVESLTREKESLVQERNRERNQYDSEIENLRSNLEKAQDQAGKAMNIITDQRKSVENNGHRFDAQELQMTKVIEEMQKLISERQDQDQKMAALEEEIQKIRKRGSRIFKNLNDQNKDLKEQLNKSLWRKLVG